MLTSHILALHGGIGSLPVTNIRLVGLAFNAYDVMAPDYLEQFTEDQEIQQLIFSP
jgi:hypothetical protein